MKSQAEPGQYGPGMLTTFGSDGSLHHPCRSQQTRNNGGSPKSDGNGVHFGDQSHKHCGRADGSDRQKEDNGYAMIEHRTEDGVFPIVFAHGLEGSPEGRKIQYLRRNGFHVLAPDGRGLPLAARCRGLDEATQGGGILLIGSSYGGLAAAHLAGLHPERFVGLLLMAPALHHAEPPVLDVDLLRPPDGLVTHVIHGIRDSVVPIAGSRRYASHGASMIETDDDHGLRQSMEVMVESVRILMDLPERSV